MAMENEGHPDIEEVLRSAFGSGKDSPWDLDEELTSIERYFALFEALNWAVSLDDRLNADWPFAEIDHGKYWCDEFAGGCLDPRAPLRSKLHSSRLVPGTGPRSTQPFQQRIELLWLSWSKELAGAKKGDGATTYRAYLAGRAVGDTLFEIGDILTAATNILVGDLRRGQTSGPAKVKESADHLYVPEDPASARQASIRARTSS